KTTRQVKGKVVWGRGLLDGTQGLEVSGYEIHMGQSRDDGLQHPFLVGADGEQPHSDGAIDVKGLVLGTYIHGLFQERAFRTAFLNNLRRGKGLSPQRSSVLPSKEEYYDRLADLVRGSLDMGKIYEICGLTR
ncbi:MAG: cobyric acid synthase CobQ, partial [Dehalococcoidia bacterium]|nr:cobyric acid synthase CobQ [Dehalococcoidia bacterium]